VWTLDPDARYFAIDSTGKTLKLGPSVPKPAPFLSRLRFSMREDQNRRITHIGPGTPAGRLLRQYWQPVALVDEFDPLLDPRMVERPIKPVRLLGQDLVLFKDHAGRIALLDRDCPHRGADLAFARYESDGIRCPFHGWKFDATGQCLETPAEPEGSSFCHRIKQRSYPVAVRSGIIFAWLGPEDQTPPPFPQFDCFLASGSHTFAFKGWLECNWLQALEVGIDPAHASYLHRYFQDASIADSYGRQFRGASSGTDWPMTKILREFGRPEILVEPAAHGLQLTALRHLSDAQVHVRVTHQVFPQAFVIPLSEEITITQWHVPVDDHHSYWYAIFTGFGAALDKNEMRRQRLALYTLPDYKPRVGRHNDWGFNAQEQREHTFTGMGQDINVHDQWAVESPGAIQDRTREHLASSDKGIMAFRRMLLAAIDAVEKDQPVPLLPRSSEQAKELMGPETIDTIVDKASWQTAWKNRVERLRNNAPWRCGAETNASSVESSSL